MSPSQASTEAATIGATYRAKAGPTDARVGGVCAGGYHPPMTTTARYAPGQRLRITQQVPRLEREGGGTMSTTVEGVVVKFEQRKTGSWFAHASDHKLWLDSLTIKKDDGELVVLNLDQNSNIEIIGA